jgi:hypothetical protein
VAGNGSPRLYLVSSSSTGQDGSAADSGDETVVLRLSGEFDVASCGDLDHQLRGDADRVVVDLSEVTLMSAAAIGVLIANAGRLAIPAWRQSPP